MTTASQNHMADFPSQITEPQITPSWHNPYAKPNLSQETVSDRFTLDIARDTSRGPLMSSASSAITSDGSEEVSENGAAQPIKNGIWSSKTAAPTIQRMGLTPSSSPGYVPKPNHVTPPTQIPQPRVVPLQQTINLNQYNPSIWGMRQDYATLNQKSSLFVSPQSPNNPGIATTKNISGSIPAPVTVSAPIQTPPQARSVSGSSSSGSISLASIASVSSAATGPASASGPVPVPVSASHVPTGHQPFFPATPWGVDMHQPQPQGQSVRAQVPLRATPVLSPTSSNIYSARKQGVSQPSATQKNPKPQPQNTTTRPSVQTPTNSGLSKQFQRQGQVNQFSQQQQQQQQQQQAYSHPEQPAQQAHNQQQPRPHFTSNDSSNGSSNHGPRAQKKNGRPSTNTELYKTELCASYMSTGGNCPYGEKCQFAHGPEELKSVDRPPKWRSKPCQNWVRTGTCSYNERCCFRHDVPVGDPN